MNAKDELIGLYTRINTLHDLSKVLLEKDFKSKEANSFSAGEEFAFRHVLALIEERIEEYKEDDLV